MHLARRDQIGRVGCQVAGQQGRDQHLGPIGDLHHRRHGVAAQHHDELDLVLVDQLLRPGARLIGCIFVIVGDNLDLVSFVAGLDAAGRVHPLGPDLAAKEARRAPGGNLSRQGGQEPDLDRVVGGQAAARSRGGGQGHAGGRRPHEGAAAQSFPVKSSCHDSQSSTARCFVASVSSASYGEAREALAFWRSLTGPRRDRTQKRAGCGRWHSARTRRSLCETLVQP